MTICVCDDIICHKLKLWSVVQNVVFERWRFNGPSCDIITYMWTTSLIIELDTHHYIVNQDTPFCIIHLGLCQCGQTPPRNPFFNFMFVIRFQRVNNGFVTQWKVNTPHSYLMTHQKFDIFKKLSFSFFLQYTWKWFLFFFIWKCCHHIKCKILKMTCLSKQCHHYT